MRIQFEIEDEMQERLLRYIGSPKMRHFIAKQALDEWVNRREGRDRKYQAEQLLSNRDILRPILREMIESGELRSE